MTTDWLEEVPCNLCGADRSRVLFHRPYVFGSMEKGAALIATTDEFQNYGRIVECMQCNLVYTNPRPRCEELVKGYGSNVDEAYLNESSSRSINAHLSLNTIKQFVSKGRLLDVGASTGYFLNAARVDFEVLGLEPSEWACRIAREQFKLEVYAEPLDGARRFECNSFEVVSMVDVIEHVADPQGALNEAARILKPEGLLYLVTPNIGSLSARLMRGYWWGLRPAHIYYFSRDTLSRMLAKAGLQVVLAKSFGRIFSYNYWASRLHHYPALIYGCLCQTVRLLRIERKLLYLDTRDSIEVCARKR